MSNAIQNAETKSDAELIAAGCRVTHYGFGASQSAYRIQESGEQIAIPLGGFVYEVRSGTWGSNWSESSAYYGDEHTALAAAKDNRGLWREVARLYYTDRRVTRGDWCYENGFRRETIAKWDRRKQNGRFVIVRVK